MGICQRLVPLATVGDGNCLLHAASLGMWGFHDRLLTLRKALFRTLVDDPASAAINRRWKLQQWQKNMEAGGLVYTDEEWTKEWDEVLRLASPNRRKLHMSEPKPSLNQPISTIHEGQPLDDKQAPSGKDKSAETNTTACAGSTEKGESEKKNEKGESEKKDSETSSKEKKSGEKESGVKENEKEKKETKDASQDSEEGAFESLEDIHVFFLAHVLLRPIIIIADKYLRDFSGDPIAPIPFGGIYLPLECPPQTCHKTPLILVFESAHFSAAVVSEEKDTHSKLTTAIPVVDQDLSMLPLHFSVDPGEKFDWSSLSEETQLPSKLTHNSEKQLQLLEKYLNIAHIRVPNAPKKDNQQVNKDVAHSAEKSSSDGDKKGKKEMMKNGENKEVSWLENSINKVGNIAGRIKKFVDTSTVCVARIETNEKPDYYDKMINNYTESAKKRFEEKAQDPGSRQPCITPGCSLYGTADTSYLCSGCYKTQKSASESSMYKTGGTASTSGNSNNTNSALKSFLPPVSLSSYVPFDYFSSAGTKQTASQSPTPPVQPPSYSEACKGRVPAAKFPRCRKEGCEFYGSEERQGYCSSCFKKEKPAQV